MPSKTPTTGEALARARGDVARARLADPDEHYPYKADEVRSLVRADTPMGPNGPKDGTASAQDFMSQRIADASAAYIDAQAAYLADSTPARREAYEVAKEDLNAARRAHRRARVDADGTPTGAVVASTRATTPEHQRGPRLRRVGEE